MLDTAVRLQTISFSGDGTTGVVVLAGALLSEAERLITRGTLAPCFHCCLPDPARARTGTVTPGNGGH